MTIIENGSRSVRVRRGSHVCWIVGEATDFEGVTRQILASGRSEGEKVVVFGPDGGDTLRSLAPFADEVLDPRSAFHDDGPLSPAAMFVMFREQAELARAEGHVGLRVVADMEWLQPMAPSAEDIVAFEVLLDEVVRDLGATVVCAYRAGSFDTESLVGSLCVHPVGINETEPPFRLVADGEGTWRLSGEIDLGVAEAFASAFGAVAGSDGCVVDASELRFIDVAGFRAIASAARASGATIALRNAPPIARRCWQLGGFDAIAPSVDLEA